MCQVHTGAHVSLLAPEKNDYTACYPGKTTMCLVCITVSTYHYAYTRQTQVNPEKRNKEKKEKKRKESKEKKRKRKRKEKKRQEKTIQEEARKGKGKKRHTSRPQEPTQDGIGLIEGIKYINGTGGKTQQAEEVRAALR